MATADSYPVGTTTNEWTLTGAATAHAATTGAYPPGDEASYVSASGFTAAKIVRLVMDPGAPSTFTKITSYPVSIKARSANLGNAPAFRTRLFVGGVLRGTIITSWDTASAWEDASVTFRNLNILGSTWDAGPVEIEIVPMNGDVGYEPVES